MHESDGNPTTSSNDNFNTQNLSINLRYHFYLSFPLVYDTICISLQVIIFYLFSITFNLILSHGVIFYCIYRLRTPFIPSL